MLIWFCQILQEGCDVFSLLLCFFLLSLLPSFLLLLSFSFCMGPIRLPSPTLQSKIPTSKLLPKGLWPVCTHLSSERKPCLKFSLSEEKLWWYIEGRNTVCLCLASFTPPTMHILSSDLSHLYEHVVWIWTLVGRENFIPRLENGNSSGWGCWQFARSTVGAEACSSSWEWRGL